MKDIVTKIYESNAPDYLLVNVVACNSETSDYILASIDTDALPRRLADKVVNLAETGKIDTAMMYYKNFAKENAKNLVKGKIIDIDGQIFISTGSGDELDEDEIEMKIFNKLSWAKSKMDKDGYILTGLTKDEHNKEVDLSKMKKLKTSMIE